MGFFSNLVSAAVKTVTIPLDVVSDASRAIQGKRPQNTQQAAKEIVEDVENAADDLIDGDL